jgi:arginyl-tRNA synthetase
MKEEIRKSLEKSIIELKKSGIWAEFKLPEVQVERPKGEPFGDYTTNIAMVLGKSIGKNPFDIAGQIVELLNNQKNEAIEKIEAVKPGYINFYLGGKYFQDLVREVIDKKEEFGNRDKKNERIMVEYSQPNTLKEFHIGHLRNAFIGSSIVNTLRKAGFDVISATYNGDTGTHVAKCLWGIEKFHADTDWENIENKTEYMGRVYSEAVQKLESSPDLEKDFREIQKKLNERDPEMIKLWEKTRQWSLDDFADIYARLGVKFDVHFYESEEERAGKGIIKDLIEKGIARESEGAIIADLEEYSLGVLVLQRNDGSVLYGLKDIPLAIKKFDQYGVDESIVLVDIRQSLYFKQLAKIIELMDFKKPTKHIGYEYVLLKGGESMSSRKGNVIPGRKLLDLVVEEVGKKFPETAESEKIGLGAARFYMLKYAAATKIEFEIDEAVRFEGATGPYVQYAMVRTGSILKKAEEIFRNYNDNKIDTSLLNHEKEISLIRELDRFGEIIEEVSNTYEVSKLPYYAIKLADKFHSFYNDCQVLDAKNPKLSEARLKLVQAVRIVLGETLRLIGVETPERM